MSWFKLSSGWGVDHVKIVKIKNIVKETPKTLVVKGRWSLDERLLKRNLFSSFEEAKASAIEELKGNVDACRRELNDAENELDNLMKQTEAK